MSEMKLRPPKDNPRVKRRERAALERKSPPLQTEGGAPSRLGEVKLPWKTQEHSQE